ncbi:MAG: hypothetical protein ACREQ9_21335, partial [Candidatus Binatia bacterium]
VVLGATPAPAAAVKRVHAQGARLPRALDPFGATTGSLFTLDTSGLVPGRHCVTGPAGYPATIP